MHLSDFAFDNQRSCNVLPERLLELLDNKPDHKYKYFSSDAFKFYSMTLDTLYYLYTFNISKLKQQPHGSSGSFERIG